MKEKVHIFVSAGEEKKIGLCDNNLNNSVDVLCANVMTKVSY
jgi:hypothetical protein